MSTRYTFVVFVILACLLPAGWSVADLRSQSAALDAPTMGAPVPFTEPLDLGTARLEPGSGAALRPLLAEGQVCGVAVQGPSTFTLEVKDPFSLPVARRNLHRASSLDADVDGGRLTIHETLEAAVIWSPELGAGLDVGKAETPESLPDWVAKILERPLFSHPSHELLTAQALGGEGVVYALIHGKKEDLLLSVDPLVERAESLYVLDTLDSSYRVDSGRWYAEELVAQPLGRRWWDRFPAPLVAVDEDLVVTNTDEEHVVVDATMTLQAERGGVRLWRTNLRDRTVEDAKEHPVSVRSVEVDGRPAAFLHQDGELLVQLPAAPRPGAQVIVHVVSEGELAIRPGGDSYWSLGTWAWYPQPPLNGELATVSITVDVPEEWTPFASGTTEERTTKDGRTRLRTRLDHPVQFPVVAAGKYTVISDDKDGIHCDVASYVFGKKKACERLIQNFYAAAEVYGTFFNHSFPFDEMNIVEVNTWGFGQAPPGVIFITKEAYNPLGETMSQLFSQGVNERLVHEIAHSWWGHLVKMDSPDEQWITESFAEYSAALCLQAVAGSKRKGEREFNKLLDHWEGEASRIKDGGSIYLANHLAMHDSIDSIDRTRLLYSKGPLVLHALRLELQRKLGGRENGDRVFFALLRSTIKNFPYGWFATRHLVGILNQITKQDWQPWFERYVYGCDTPEL